MRQMANRHDFGVIPPKMKVFALEESALEQVNSPFAVGRDEPLDRHLADPEKEAHGGRRGRLRGDRAESARRERVGAKTCGASQKRS